MTVDVLLSYDPHTGGWRINRSDQPVAGTTQDTPITASSSKPEGDHTPIAGTSQLVGEASGPVAGTSQLEGPVTEGPDQVETVTSKLHQVKI